MGTADTGLLRVGSRDSLRGFLVLSVLRNKRKSLRDPLLRDKGQMGSLAGAAYLLNDNAGVLNLTQ